MISVIRLNQMISGNGSASATEALASFIIDNALTALTFLPD
jgi:hypothetical protein